MSFWSCWENKFRCTFLAPPVFDLTGVKYKVVDINGAKKVLSDSLAKTNTAMRGDSYKLDQQYLLYSEETIRKVYKLLPPMYNHSKFLSDKINKAGEGYDCENSAEYRSYYFHMLLPSCCAITVSQPGHRFMGVASFDSIVWFNGTPDKYDYIYHVVY